MKGTRAAGPSTRAGAGTPDKMSALRACGLFATLEAAELRAIEPHARVRRFGRGQPILRRTDVSLALGIILHGRVRVSSASPEGREVILGLLGPGELLGEIAFLDGRPRSADASAVEECTVLLVEREPFMALLRESPALCLRLMEVLCARLRQANARTEEMAMLGLSERLGQLLLRLAESYGSPTPLGPRIALRLSQKDLSSLVGASRERVNRQIRSWELDGVIARDGGRLVLLSPERLAAR